MLVCIKKIDFAKRTVTFECVPGAVETSMHMLGGAIAEQAVAIRIARALGYTVEMVGMVDAVPLERTVRSKDVEPIEQ